MDARKEVLSFSIYMWNKWSKSECAKIFNAPGQEWQYSLGEHIWNKWIEYVKSVGQIAAPSMCVANFDEETLYKIVDRACELYVGRRNR